MPPREDARALPVVGLGGSAGSLAALQAFFQGVPPKTTSAYVVVLHLSPEHESHLAELLSRASQLIVQQVTGPVKVERGHVYVIPPGKNLEMRNGSIHLRRMEPERGTRAAIDFFFRTLAATHGPQAAAVVLSGTGADGTLGLRQIKELGGLTVAQSPAEADYDGMPRSAIGSGLVDLVLPASSMAAQIESYWQTSRQMRLPAEAAPSPEQREEGQDLETALTDVLAQVRAQSGHDFGRYKRATVLRRIGRRMQVCGVETLPAYLDFIRRHTAEVGALVSDLLISVTEFFRDPAVWEALERETLPRIFQERREGEQVRSWVCGCATGEEAYTLAILQLEEAARSKRSTQVQIFATDMVPDVIAKAREGFFPETISAQVPPAKLQRWFLPQTNGGYRIRKEVRETVLFASHDVLKDTPFSRLDLITCRNLLIYLNRDAQDQVLETFHFALRPNGHLLLGPSESVDGAAALFGAANKQHRLFVRRPVARTVTPRIGLPADPSLPQPPQPAAASGSPTLRAVLDAGVTPATAGPFRPATAVSEVHRELLELYAPPSVLVGPEHDVLHMSDRAVRFMRLSGGEPTQNLLQLVHSDLRVDLRAALYTAAAEGQEQSRLTRGVRLGEGVTAAVRVIVRPVKAPGGVSGYFLVLFEETSSTEKHDPIEQAPPGPDTPGRPSSEDIAQQLENENATLQRQLRSTVDQFEATTEELKASNEELQAMNEEQRSAAEELETSKEELQSLNEELSTVNQELRASVDELGRLNSDLQNFLAATDIGTVFLDRQLNIKRFTPAAASIFHLIPTDVGRPLSDLTTQLDYPTLRADSETVLAQLSRLERHITSVDRERHYLVRLLPYRSLDDHIEGVVLNFIDVTERQQAERARQLSDERLRLIVEGAKDYAIFTIDPQRNVESWSAGAQALFGYSEAEVAGKSGDVLFLVEDREAGMPLLEVQQAAAKGRAETERWHIRNDGSRFYGSGLTRPLNAPDGEVIGFVKVIRDLTEEKEAEEARAFLAAIVESSQDAVLTVDFSGVITSWNRSAADLYGYPAEEALGKQLSMLTLPEDLQAMMGDIGKVQRSEETLTFDSIRVHKSGRQMCLEVVHSPVRNAQGDVIGVSTIARDVTERRQAEEALRRSESRFRTLADAVPQLIWTNTGKGVADYFNRRWHEYSGLSYEESAGAGWEAIAHPDDAPGAVARWHSCMERGEVFDTEYRLRRADGVYRWFIGRNIPLRDAAGEVTAWFGSATDIEDLKQAQAAEGAAQERLRLLVEGARDYAMFLLDLDARITYWSAGAERIFGWEDSEVIGQDTAIIFTPEDREARAPEQEAQGALRDGRASDRRWHVRKDGSRFWADGLLMRLDDEAGRGRGFAKVTRDATEQKEAEETLRDALEAVARANEELEERVEARTAELAQMSQLRQELLRQLVNAQEEERGRIARDLHDDTGQQMSVLLLGLDQLGKASAVAGDSSLHEMVARLEAVAGEIAEKSHRIAFTLRPTALDDLGLASALDEYARAWQRWSGVVTEVEMIGLETRLPTEFETTIYRVTQEALTNVLRHAAGIEGKRGATRVSILVQRRANEILTVIEDDGPGFDVEVVLNLPPGQRRLGVFGMQERARLAGGTLTVESEPGRGTSVYLRLPLSAGDSNHD